MTTEQMELIVMAQFDLMEHYRRMIDLDQPVPTDTLADAGAALASTYRCYCAQRALDAERRVDEMFPRGSKEAR